MKILPFVRLFLAADTGGGSAVADPPAAPAPASSAAPTSAEVAAALESFEPPSLDILTAAPAASEPEPQKEPAKPEKPGKQAKADAKPADGKKPVDNLREAYETAKKERDELRAQVENHPKVRELSESLKSRDTELQTLREQLSDRERKLEMTDPLASSKLREIQTAFDTDYQRATDLMPEIQGDYQNLVSEFARLDRTDNAKYRAALGAFEDKVENLVGTKKFNGAMEIINRGVRYMQEHAAAAKDLQQNAGKMAFEGREKQWRENESSVASNLKAAFDAPNDLEKADPFSPLLFINRGLKELPDEARQKLEEPIDTFIKTLFAGPRPKTAKDFPGMNPQQIQEALAKEGKWIADARNLAPIALKRGLVAMALMRPFLAEYAKMKERIAKEAAGTPPDPTKGGEGSGGAEGDDLATYKAPAIPNY